MKGQKTYSKAMDLAIEQASIVLAQCGKLGGELDEASGVFDDRDGNNPNVQKMYLMLKLSEQSRKWLRELHLTLDTAGASTEEDAISKLINDMRNDGQK
ncbi:hypothetical protein DWW88_21280 [Bacteroides cellulosilyticus]|nr:hypothetical protein DWW88_21280 [Bacteroides cellulosilyticus]